MATINVHCDHEANYSQHRAFAQKHDNGTCWITFRTPKDDVTFFAPDGTLEKLQDLAASFNAVFKTEDAQ